MTWKRDIAKAMLGSAAEAFGSTVGSVLAAKLLGVRVEPSEENEETKKETRPPG